MVVTGDVEMVFEGHSSRSSESSRPSDAKCAPAPDAFLTTERKPDENASAISKASSVLMWCVCRPYQRAVGVST